MADLIGAVEAGGTKFVLAITDAGGAIVDRTRIDTRGGAETLAEMADWFDTAQRPHGRIAAFGIASFGPIGIDPGASDYGTLLTTVKPGWQGPVSAMRWRILMCRWRLKPMSTERHWARRLPVQGRGAALSPIPLWGPASAPVL